MIDLAKNWLVDYFSDGETRQPSDFDEDFLGGLDVHGTVLTQFTGYPLFSWDKTPFFEALGELVEEGNISHWIEGEAHFYVRR